ncbi:hypothetical protein DUNSADRAFT_16873 [Dunaliella salina]|uniref:Encoded protein n=1 Tax=Dunaliella salina TaxID=3046 RepID=A0ABQ7H939_DUNSA|nr:hypothetical protein DUNSADRAFT_16873 [Dunaliella salina]|eukprot:KAF5843374.1 hypothetical protein DUNSADRAFT_16873 [Dunaliella salina]
MVSQQGASYKLLRAPPSLVLRVRHSFPPPEAFSGLCSLLCCLFFRSPAVLFAPLFACCAVCSSVHYCAAPSSFTCHAVRSILSLCCERHSG